MVLPETVTATTHHAKRSVVVEDMNLRRGVPGIVDLEMDPDCANQRLMVSLMVAHSRHPTRVPPMASGSRRGWHMADEAGYS